MLNSVDIPNSVTTIGSHAFHDCFNLSSIFIPNSIAKISSYAFYGCTRLKSVTIPNSVTEIGDNAFRYCQELISITIPKSVTAIGTGVFSGCSGLTNLIVDSDNKTYDSRGNCNAIIEKSSNTLFAGCKSTAIPSSIIAIGKFAFSNCSGLSSIIIPSSVTTIGYNAFSDCYDLYIIKCLAIAPPNPSICTKDAAFYGINQKKCKLFVPKGSIDYYKHAPCWMRFKHISAIEDMEEE